MGRRKTGEMPAMKQHPSGAFYVRLNGKQVWLGSDPTAAVGRFAAFMGASAATSASTPPSAAPIPTSAPQTVVEAPAVSGKTADEWAATLVALLINEVTPQTLETLRFDLKPFLDRFGKVPLDSVTATDLIDWRNSIGKGKSPCYINHILAAARRLLRLADYPQTSLVVRALKPAKGAGLKRKALDPAKVQEVLSKVHAEKPNLARILLLAFYCVLRPSEIPSVVYGKGDWVKKNVFAIHSKTTNGTGELRKVCFSPQALALLKTIEPQCPNYKNIKSALFRLRNSIGDFTAHPLRHSAATALTEAGVEGELIETALGHRLPYVSATYRPLPLERTCKALEVLPTLVKLPK